MKAYTTLLEKPKLLLMLFLVILSPFMQYALSHCPHVCPDEEKAVALAQSNLDATLAMAYALAKVTAAAGQALMAALAALTAAELGLTIAIRSKNPWAIVAGIAAVFAAIVWVKSAISTIEAAEAVEDAQWTAVHAARLVLYQAEKALETCYNNTTDHPCCPD